MSSLHFLLDSLFLFEECGLSTLLKLPDDVFAIISKSLLPSDVCNLSLCCRSLFDTADSDKVWNSQCVILEIVSPQDIAEWRKGVASYKALCRFLVMVRPLMGIWVDQNPELGNAVYVVPGFVSVVGCRIIPQVVCQLGIEAVPILWAPVFEIIGDFHGSAAFFLHGREKGHDYLYPGSVKSVERRCNVLWLEVEPSEQKSDISKRISRDGDGVSGSHTTTKKHRFGHKIFSSLKEGFSSQKTMAPVVSQNDLMAPFSRLSFDDRKMLLESVTRQVRQNVPNSTIGPLFPCLRDGEGEVFNDMIRRSILLKINKSGMGCIARHKAWSVMLNLKPKLREFLGSNDSRIELILRASSMELSTHQAWPVMDESQYALYKMPSGTSRYGDDYAGLWGGTFGWPPWEPGKAMLFLSLSYKKSRLIATKILEIPLSDKKSRFHRPNGSAVFVVKINHPSEDVFPWDTYPESCPVNVVHAFTGKGITDGYGFLNPSSKPGSLFVTENGLLVFVWEGSQKVLTLQRINLQELLRNGEQVHALPPIPNFTSCPNT